MIRLGLPREPHWLRLPQAVRVKVRPLTTAVYEAARFGGQRRAVRIATEQGLIRAAGGTIDNLPDGEDDDAVAGLSQMFFIQKLAVHAIIEWEGVGDADGKPLPPTADNVETYIRDTPLHAADFAIKYMASIPDAVAEGNGSGAAPSGTSAAAPITADRAEPTGSPAPTADGDATASDAPPA